MGKSLVIVLTGLSAVMGWGAEAPLTPMRQKLLAKGLAAAPAVSPEKRVEEKGQSDGTVVKMEAFTVVESTRARDLDAAVNRERDKIQAEQFSLSKGGTLYRRDFGGKRVELGGWWDSTSGWNFMRILW